MRLGFSTALTPTLDAIDIATNHGYGHIEIDLAHEPLEYFTEEKRRRIKSYLQGKDISLSLHTPLPNLSARLIEARNIYINYLEHVIDLATELGADFVVSHTGMYYQPKILENIKPTPRGKAIDIVTNSLTRLANYADNKKISLAVENDCQMIDSELHFTLSNTDALRRVFNGAGLGLKFALDIGHANTAEGYEKYIREFGDRIICVHIHDNYGKKDEHLPLGDGTVDWQDALEELKNIDYRGPFVFETFQKSPGENKKDLQSILKSNGEE